MAIPQNTLSTEMVPAPMMFDKDRKVTRRSDFEMGGIAIQDPSQGLLVQEWNFYITPGLDQIRVRSVLGGDHLLYSGSNITEVSGTFDQNMRPLIVFREDGLTRMEWYDPLIGGRTVTTYGPDYITPKVSLDDKRSLPVVDSDIIFAYIWEGALCMRVQRDRYTVQYILHPFISHHGELHCIGMLQNMRFGFQSRLPEHIRDR